MAPKASDDYLYARFEEELRADVDDSHVDYEAMWSSLASRVDTADGLGALMTLKVHEIPTEEFWERVEQGLSQRIHFYHEYEEPVKECIEDAGSAPRGGWAAVENTLFDRIAEAEELPEWERELKAEMIPTEGQLERIEERLMQRIDEHEQKEARKPRILAFPVRTALRAAAVLALAVLGGAAGLAGYHRYLRGVPTFVYQAQGADAGLVGTTDPTEKRFATTAGGAVKLVNRHGYVHLQNGADLKLERATRAAARYRLEMNESQADGAAQKATFFVEGREQRAPFVVATAEYDIEVTGTYFRISPDLGGRIRTEVLEGKVKAESPALGSITLVAGQSLAYDTQRGRYVVRDGGLVVAREDVARVPSADALENYHPLTVNAAVPFCDVSIDGNYVGGTPLRILLKPGMHRIRISHEGYAQLDTTLQTGTGSHKLYAVLTEQKKPGTEAGRREQVAVRQRPGAQDTAAMDTLERTAAVTAPSARLMLEQARRLERTDWRAALEKYEELLANPDAPRLLKETALFAAGRLRLEQAADTNAARESFLRYLTLYPSGTFTRESLLRLAEIEFAVDVDKAIDYYLRYFEKYPMHHRVPELQYRVGLIYLQRKRYDDAAYMLEQALSNLVHNRDSLRPRIYRALHKAMLGKGDMASARLIEEKYLGK